MATRQCIEMCSGSSKQQSIENKWDQNPVLPRRKQEHRSCGLLPLEYIIVHSIAQSTHDAPLRMANSVHSGAIAGSAAWAATWLPTSGGEALHRLQARRMEDVRARCERFLASRPSLCAVHRLVSGGRAGNVDQAGRGWVDQISQADCTLLLIALQRSSLHLRKIPASKLPERYRAKWGLHTHLLPINLPFVQVCRACQAAAQPLPIALTRLQRRISSQLVTTKCRLRCSRTRLPSKNVPRERECLHCPTSDTVPAPLTQRWVDAE